MFFAGGVLAGKYFSIFGNLPVNEYMQYALMLLMFGIGISFGSDKPMLKILQSFNYRYLFLPITTILGTFFGAAVYILLSSSPNPADTLAIAAGFGYYSLSGILISEFSGADIAIIALLANVLREILTLILSPVLKTFFGELSPICSAGATSMDTTLPVIIKVSGKNYLIAAMVHGIVLTLLVPFIISTIYKLF